MGAAAQDLTTEHVAVRDILGRICIELRRSTAAVERLEETISDYLFDEQRGQAHLQVDLQNIDLVRQELAGLADFVAQLVPEIEDRVLVDIARACGSVTLQALVSRLRACNSDEPASSESLDEHDWFLV